MLFSWVNPAQWQNFISTIKEPKFWKLAVEPSTLAPADIASNKDQDPVPEDLRTWTSWDFATYWMSDLINVTSWQIASAALLVGLSTVDAIIITLLSGILNSIPIVFNGAPGTDYHIPFPIAIRSSYGYYFGYFCVVSRGALSIIWFAVNCWVGSFAVTETIAAVWPRYKAIENQLPADAQITSLQMTSYLIFFLIQVPFFYIPLIRLKRLFLWKAILLVPVSLGMVVWICVKAGDIQGVFSQPATVSGSTRTWLWLSTFSATSNSWLSATVNMSDFSRLSKTRYGPYSQIPTIPIVKTIYAILGIATVGASRILYNADIWSPVEILPLWTGSGGRFFAFFCGCLWILAQISCNLSANAIPFGHDLMNILPAWINVRRGTIICLVIGTWAVVPWMLVNSASNFLQFMNGYGCVIGVIVSIMLSDYWLVRQRRLDVPALYDPRSRYRYLGGINWRAAMTQVVFVAMSLPGLIHQINPTVTIPEGLVHLYKLNWFINTFGPFLVYWLLWKIWPARETLISNSISKMVVPGIDQVLPGREGLPKDMSAKLEKAADHRL